MTPTDPRTGPAAAHEERRDANPAPRMDRAGPDPFPAPSRVVVVGAGLIGTSIGLALRARGVDVRLADRDPDRARGAARRGAGSVLGGGGEPVDVVVLAVPPGAVPGALLEAQRRVRAAAFTDVAGVKGRPLDVARALGCDLRAYVPGHPMAGGERSGPDAARGDLFRGCRWALCPGPATAEPAVRTVSALVEACGAEPCRVDAAEHDRVVALSSHLPHLVAAALAARLADADATTLALTGRGFRDVTRIAAGDAGLWTDILEQNADHVATVTAEVADDLRAAAAALHDPGHDGHAYLTALLRRGIDGRTRLEAP